MQRALAETSAGTTVLTESSGTELALLRRRSGTLLAALAPDGTTISRSDRAALTIAVSADPPRAAAQVATRLLPRYLGAVQRARNQQATAAADAARAVLAAWDSVSDSLCGANHQPQDDRYDRRMRVRDAQMWACIAPLLDYGPALVQHAQRTLGHSALHPDMKRRLAHRLGHVIEAMKTASLLLAECRAAVRAIAVKHPACARPSRTRWPTATRRAGTPA